MKRTRQKLLENFDEEVHDKLRISFDESRNTAQNMNNGSGN